MGFAGIDLITGGGTNYADVAAQQEADRQKRITEGTASINKAFSGFTPEFYRQRAQSYIDYAMPQLSKQYTTTRNQIGFGLSNRGLQQSSAAEGQFSDLNRTMGEAQQQVGDTAIAQSSQLEQQVNQAKDVQLANLYQSADPANASAAATSTAAGFATPSTFAPVANAFSNLLNQYYYSQLVNNYRPTSFVMPPNQGGSTDAFGPVTVSGS